MGSDASSRESAQRYILEAILESPRGVVILALDREYRYVAFNDAHRRGMKQLWNVDIYVGQNMLYDVVGREDDRVRAKRNFDRALAGEHFVRNEAFGDENLDRGCYEDVYRPIVEADGAVIGLTICRTDITQQRLTQELESLGAVAGKLAHDFDDLVVGILGNADLALRGLGEEKHGDDEALRLQLGRIKIAAARAAELSGQMLAYAGKGPRVRRALDLGTLASEMVDSMNDSVSKPATLVLDLASNLRPFEGDDVQDRQVPTNLVSDAADAIGDAPAADAARPTAAREWRGSGTVLLADDEPRVREVLKMMMRDVGFEVLESANVSTCLDVYREHRREISLLVVDLMMPGGEGRKVVSAIRAEGDRVPIIVSSGYSEDAVGPELRSDPLVALLEKPYDFDTFMRTVRGILEAQKTLGQDDISWAASSDPPRRA